MVRRIVPLTRSRSGILFHLLAAWVCLPLGASAVANALTFGPAAVLNSNAYTDGGPYAGEFDPHMATDGAGTWVVVWQSKDDLGGTIGVDEDIFFARSSDNGFTWTPVAPLNTDAATDRPPAGVFGVSDLDVCPKIATDTHGNWVAAWLRRLGDIGNSLLLVARSNDNGATWTSPTVASSLPDNSMGCPFVTTDGAGTWILVTRRRGAIFQDRDNLVTRSFNNGTTWTPLAILNDGPGAYRADRAGVYGTAPGEWLALWNAIDPPGGDEFTDQHTFYSRSTDNGATWSVAARLLPTAEPNLPDLPTDVASDGAGNWVIAWATRADGDNDVFFSRSSDNAATWSTPASLNSDAATDSDSDYYIRLATNGLGIWVAIWSSRNTLGDTIGEDPDIFYAVSNDNGATWSEQAVLNSYAATDPDEPWYSGSDEAAQLATDGSGRFLALWIAREVEEYGVSRGLIGSDYDLLLSLSDHPCGNGILDPGEDCDDGDRFNRDCCDSACAFEPSQSLCTPPDADGCTADICDGAGLCEHLLVPQPGCRRTTLPGKTKLTFRDYAEDSKDTFIWNWTRGEATDLADFDNPVSNNHMEYTLCVFDQSGEPQPILQATAPGNSAVADDCKMGLCDWKESGRKGFRYRDKELANDGLSKIKLRAGEEGMAMIKVMGEGENLLFPELPVAVPVVVQLKHSESDICWEAEFSTFQRNDTSQFKARGD